MTVLVVEDEDQGRETLRDLLQDEGYRVVTARDGREAMERLTTPSPSLVILDLRMPGMNGTMLYHEMQRTPQLAKIPVLVTTAVPELAPPGVPTLEKPLKVDRLLELVALACGRV
jgi:CheY-like chemotaxis protein